jgi:hypothetical protein
MASSNLVRRSAGELTAAMRMSAMARCLLLATLLPVLVPTSATGVVKKYKSCRTLRLDYPGGVARRGSVDRVLPGQVPTTGFTVNTKQYKALPKSFDRDRDGIACERIIRALPQAIADVPPSDAPTATVSPTAASTIPPTIPPTSPSTTPATAPPTVGVVTSGLTRYPNCTALNATYPHGVGLTNAVDKTSGGSNPVTIFHRDDALYAAQPRTLDRDEDGIACEKA